MLELLNRYCHGLVSIPVLHALRERGVLARLAESTPVSVEQLAYELSPNRAYLDVALRMLVYLDWIRPTTDGKYEAMPALTHASVIPDRIMDLYRFPFDRYVVGGADDSLEPWLELSTRRWNSEDAHLPDFLDGLIVVPLLLSAHAETRLSVADESTLVLNVEPAARGAIERLFLANGWAARSGDVLHLNRAGRFVIDRIFITAMVASYRPMLERAADLLFGDAARVFASDAAGDETHVDRTKSVIGSGFQQENDLLQFLEQYFLPAVAGSVAGMDDGRSALAESETSVARAVANDVRALVAGYPFAAEDDPRAAEREMATFAFRWLLAHLQQMGVMRDAGESYEIDELERRLGVAPKYHRYFGVLMRRLQDEGLLTARGRGIETTSLVRDHALESIEEDVPAFIEQFGRCFPSSSGLMNLARACLARYDEILTGRIDVTSVVFPDANMDVFGALFRGGAVSEFFNRVAADAVRSAAGRLKTAATKVRILEIGAGTGGTTTAIVNALKPYSGAVEFCFSDISNTFLRNAKRRFANESWVDYRLLNIEKELSGQGFEPHSFDIVIAANVLHDTSDIDVTLRQVRTLLRSGGLLVLDEFTAFRDCLLFSGALLHGYWLFQDPEKRLPDTCLLGPSQWKEALERTGFALAGAHALPTQSLDGACSQSVMLCEALGADPVVAEKERTTERRNADGMGAVVQQQVLLLLGEQRASAYSAQRPLMDMGLDSLELVELKTLLEGQVGVKLSPVFLFEHETPAKLAAALSEIVGDESAPLETTAVVTRTEEEHDAIAIVGVACRFAGGVDSAESFWKLLESGKNGIVPMPAGRWRWPDFIDPQGKHKGIDRGGFLDRIDEFDALFFGVSPKEAQLMDPQQRLLLELSWEAIEDGGHRASELSGRKIGVFVGVCHSDYRELLASASDSAEAYVGTGSANSLLANRISYFCDFKGPSVAVDTACSSALVALHDAVTAIRRGDCEQALAGAVNLLSTPTISISYYRAGMLSPSGVCRTFDASADGYVRGEGGAMLLLKPLATALADGDSIYGLVKGTAVNHGGQAASLTAPKPDAQAAVIEAAWREAAVALDSAGYVETHGTGTPLGDPIEVAGLIEAFRRLYRARGEAWPAKSHCGLGSVKTNIGHLEGAAGMAGLIKVLMAMQHRSIPPTLHFERLNPEIDLADSPFYIAHRAQVWEACRDENRRELPRRAGVSSFGSGGSNAHAVVEEFPVSPTSGDAGNGEYLIPLSAKNEDRLREQARRLLRFLESDLDSPDPVSLADVAYTLQIGREAMEERVAFVVEDTEELITALDAYIAGSPSIRRCYRGRVTNDGKRSGESGPGRDLGDLASQWVAGADIDWTRFSVGGRRRRIHLPAYAFARERHWVVTEPRPVRGGEARLHPLLHQNTSDLSEQRFSATFTGEEFFLDGHRVGGRRVLPAVAYLEMAREAVARALAQADVQTITIRNVVWARPVVVGQEPQQVHIALNPKSDTEVGFEIYSGSPGPQDETVHARGVAIVGGAMEAPRLDVEALTKRYQQHSFTADVCYATFARLGFDYRDQHRAVEGLHVETNEVVAKLALPPASIDGFVLHPGMVDSALQSFMGFVVASASADAAAAPSVPFELRSAEIYGSCTPRMWAVARRVGRGRVDSFDIDLCDEDGNVRVRFSGLSTRSMDGDREETLTQIAEPEPVIAVDDSIRPQLQAALVPLVSKLARVAREDVKHDSDFSGLGLDSIAYFELADEVNETWGLEVEPTVFFEHRTLGAFAGHLAETYREKLAKHFVAPSGAAAPRVPEKKPEKKIVEKPRRSRFSSVAAKAPVRSGTAEPIAIVGMSGRFPMAKDVDELWENLLSGRDCITEIPPDRWDWREVYGDTGQENKTHVKWGGFIDGVDEFDPAFFSISPREAALMDPQQRLLLMYAWKAIEDAGYAPSQLSGSNTAIFFGVGIFDYVRIIARSQAGIDAYLSTGTVGSVGPNRVSYYLNLHGPSNPVDTACSSSLVAIHRAVSAMKSGECDTAIVGGVNTILTPDLHISFSKGGFLSPDGRCKTFSDRADGYVRSEGVAALFLKRLSAAEEAGDHIYGLIVGSAENHGGRANTLTSPNPLAQAELLKRGYTEAGVDPRAVTYVEAHGTGTVLGDPIEIEGLKNAFSYLHRTRGVDIVPGQCGLGSVKSNIGHSEFAAGVSGVIKVLLQMKHRTLVPTLHCDTINPYIRLEGSPFYIVQKTREWIAARDERGTELPRCAGVSSFAFGGANAAVVLQEYVPPARVRRAPASRHAVVFSARNRERLREQSEQFLSALRTGRFTDADLADIAYTLQVGREAMDERLGFAVSSLSELADNLQAFLGGDARPGLYSARAPKGEDLLTSLTSDEAFQGAIDKWIEQGRVERLVELWVKGLGLDWSKLHCETKPQRISLPTYPFARTRCWIDTVAGAPSLGQRVGAAALHPLLHSNTSDLNEQRFSSSFRGDEFFLKAQTDGGTVQKVLAGAPLLEMARAAIERALPERPETAALELQTTSWEHPFVVAADKQVHIALFANDGGEIEYEIYSEEGEQEIVHCEGRAVWSRQSAPERLDLEQLERNRQSVTRLRLPATQEQTSQDYVLHPSLIDEAQQACANLNGFGRTRSPFALESLRIFAPCTREMVAWVRYAAGSSAADAIVRTDVDLCDERGNVGAQLRGVSWRQVSAPVLEPVPALTIAAPAERKKPVGISLTAPAMAASPAGVSTHTPITLSIAKPSGANADGILSVDVAAFAPEDAALRLRQTLETAQQDPALKVVVLSGLDRAFPGRGREAYNRAVEQKLYESLVTFPYPVIAALPGDTSGAGFLAAALCDLMVCNEDASYWYTDPDEHFHPTSAETLLFSERFGEVLAQDFLYASSRSTGGQLRDKGWTCPFVPGSQVVSHAQKLAATVATKPRKPLGLVKEHLIRHLVGRVAGLTPVDAADAAEESRSDANLSASRAAHVRVDRASEDVLVVTLGHAEADVLARELGEVFAATHGACKAMVLASDDPDFLPETMSQDVVAEFQRVLIDCSVPVVAALVGDARRHAWLVSQFCDACVYSKTGVYSSAGIAQNRALAESAAAMFMHRLGDYAGGEIVLTGGDYSGAGLRERVGTLIAAERDQVLSAAVGLAECFARLPRTTLSSWKQQTATLLREKTRRLEALPWDASDDVSSEPFAEPRSIALQSNVVTVTAHPDGIVVVKVEDREAKNMFSDAFIGGIKEAFAHIEQGSAYKVVVLTGYDTYFAAGANKEILLGIQSGKIRFTDVPIFDLPLHCKLPVIAAIQGHAIGAGWTLGTFADVVLHSAESRYFNPYLEYGFAPADGSTLVFPEKLGTDLSTESFLTAQRYTGRELKQRGLKLPVLPRSEVYPAAVALARRMAQMSRGQLIALKRRLSSPVREQLEETYRLEVILHDKTIRGQAEALARIQSEFYEAPASAPEPVQVVAGNEAAPAEAMNAVAVTLRKLLATELQMPESDIDENAPFVDLGLDSILSVTWVKKINETYRTSIEAARVYSHPTLAQLSRYVTEQANKRGTLPTREEAPAAPPASVSLLNETVAPPPPKVRSSRRRTRARSVTSAPAAGSEQAIAIIGMAGQFPKAKNLDEFWRNIAAGRDCVTEVPRHRWDVSAWYQPGAVVPGKTNCRWAGALDDYDVFDPLFFNISPNEAECMDPQQRLFLQECWHAIENAGYDARRLSGSRCGVFAGCATNDYQLQSREQQLSAYGWTGDGPSILAARISYFLNLHGPCLSIDTACSSALVAVAQACDSLISGASDLALAGGVFVMAGPEMHIRIAQAGMMSPQGKCFTFDQRADGFVPGEGVGVVLLKRLADAEGDGDIIHAVIHGWGVNQDGKTNGITAPNPESQTRLEQEVYEKHGIDPSDIQLIEAHGTGTKLGDPIEVEGLKQAFGKYTQKRNYCAVGSVKTNIGHCGTAAGAAGLLKAVLAVKHKQLPPTIHFERMNEHIDLQDSPFYVNTRLQEWKLNGADRRLSAVSSFGFSGTNAHVVVGEYRPAAEAEVPVTFVPQETATIIPLSARTPEQLRQKARDLLEFIRNEGPVDLTRMAYTLQAGREAMEERVAFLVCSVDELATKLAAYVEGDLHVDGMWQGRVARATIIGECEDAEKRALETWIAQRDLPKLAERWADGLEPDWNGLYGEGRPRRICLTAYPFAREHYWIQPPADGAAPDKGTTSVLHPLLHSNTSDLKEQRYSSTFTGDEFFLADHLLRTDGETLQKVLPGVALLEMVRAAVEQALPAPSEGAVLELRNTGWAHPIFVTQSRRVSIALLPTTADQLEYQVYSMDGDEKTVHAQGGALWTARPAPGKLDLQQLEARMAQGTIGSNDLYSTFQRIGIIHGPSFQAATAVHRGSDETLTRLRLPVALEPSSGEYVLHPSIMDAALHGSLPLIGGWSDAPRPKIPFALDSIRVFSPCTPEMVAWIRYSPGVQPVGDLVKLDVDLCDPDGNICIEMRGFTPRALSQQSAATAAADERDSWYSEAEPAPAARIDADSLAEKTEEFLRKQLAGLFKLPSHKIDPQVPLAKYGADSIMTMKLTNQLERTFGSLSKTLFFEYQTIRELAGYFVANHSTQLTERFAPTPIRGTEVMPPASPALPPAPAKAAASRRFSREGTAPDRTRTNDDPIAIIGLSGRYPQADTIEAFWRNLCDGKDCITEIPQERWDWREYFTEDRRKTGHLYTKWGGFITGADEFDPLFFNMSPLEAQQTDPQERLFLQHAWMAIEDAGYTRTSLQVPCENDLPGQVGVYAGVWCSEYQLCGVQASARGEGRGIAVSTGSIANRVSYALNLHGPSYTVDTMCSASLTAIHLACQDLNLGRTSMAIAGGVNLSLHPNKYLMLCDTQGLSLEGRCQAFGDGGDGFIPSEGVGIVVLKRLSDARRDGDHIYGLIRGSALNHGGRTSGFTVPNPQAQATAISRALAESHTDPRHISYLEAHGTGTKLGDPIEIAALNKVFQQNTQDTQFCAIGSVKSNIGHCESAAGVAGLTKILLQMQHREIVPSLHTVRLNPHIDFENSPFVVSRSLQPWEQPVVDGRTLPRIAGISSFGAGGANAHLIIEEYQAPVRPPMAFTDVVILLSARTAAQLQQKVRDLLDYVRERQNTIDLAATAYTLQVGREAMDERLAFVVSSVGQLIGKLQAYLAGDQEVEGTYYGQVKRSKETLSVFGSDPDLQNTVEKWIAGRKFSRLLDLWTKGLEIDWNKHYGDVRPPRVTLPAYPFAKERYWIEAPARPHRASDYTPATILHPLLHRNTSILSEQRYSSTFTGNEFFLADHQLRTNGAAGRKVLPGVAYLEMVRAAIEQALPARPQSSVLELRNTVWTQPVVVAGDKQINIALTANGDQHIDYEVYSEEAGEKIVHCQGRALWSGPSVPETLDLAQLGQTMAQAAIEPQSLYATWARMGLVHGASFHGLTAVRHGSGQALAQLRLPDKVAQTLGDYVLHPSLMDGALQAAVGLITGWTSASGQLLLPFTLESLRIVSPCTTEMFAWVRYAPGSQPGDRVVRLDIDLCDSDGRVCVRMGGFGVRALDGSLGETGKTTEATITDDAQSAGPMAVVTMAPVWDAVDVELQETPRAFDRVVVIGGAEKQHHALRQEWGGAEVLSVDRRSTVEEIAAKLQGETRIDHVVWILPEAKDRKPESDALIEEQDEGVLLGFRLIKALLRDGYGSTDLAWTVITSATQRIGRADKIDATHASVHGLAGSMAKEYANWKVRAADVGSGAWPWKEIFRLPWDQRGDGWAYRHGQWYRRLLLECELAESGRGESGYERQGVYVVIGGAGGVGEVLTEYLIRTYDARVAWIGRREKDEGIEEKLERVTRSGGERPLYIVADARKREDLERACQEIKAHYGRINGVIHSSIVLADKSLANMSEEQFRAALSAKVDVAVRLEQVFGREPLDFILYFSSVQSFFRVAGQSNYAAGCTFTDAFAEWQSANAQYPVKVMNWGYWGSVGIVAGTEYQQRMARLGVGSIEPEEGMSALERLLRAPLDQVGMIRTDGAAVARELGIAVGEALCVARQEAPSVCELLASGMPAAGRDESGRELMRGWEEQLRDLDDVLAKVLWSRMRSMAWKGEEPAGWTEAEWKRSAAAIGGYDRWLEQSLRILVRRAHIEEAGGRFHSNNGDGSPVDDEKLWREWEIGTSRWEESDQSMRGRLKLVDATLRNLREILRGEKRATDVMFPNSSLDLVAGVYKNNAMADFFNGVMAEVAGRYVEARTKEEGRTELRLLELGAGTGASSEAILRRLDRHRQSIREYCYSDISKVFLLHGEEAYGEGREYLTYTLVDVEKGIEEQGLERGAYDVVLAANVLHATRRLRETLRNAKAALKKNGLLVLNEFVRTSVYAHVTFGLLDGWWLYEDKGLRMEGSPGLTTEAWKRVLEEEGFGKVWSAVPDGDGVGQQIIVAESDGIIRQERASRTRPAGIVSAVAPRKAPATASVMPPAAIAPAESSGLQERLEESLADAVCALLKVKRDDIDLDAELSEFGFDSISLTRFANHLNEAYGLELTPAIFYEHTTVRSVARHLVKDHGERLAGRFEIPKAAHVEARKSEEASSHAAIRGREGLRRPAPAAVVRPQEPRQKESGAEPIAVIGMSGRFPGAEDLDAFWENLEAGRDSIVEIPRERWDWRAYYGDEKEDGNKSSVKWGGFIEGVDEFDPLFFGISPMEAVHMDPQQRLLIMYGWKAFEDAGYATAQLWGSRTAIFVGATTTGYGDLLLMQARAGIEGYSASGLAPSIGPARLSYFLNLHGPCEPVETACSSSLVAIHRAVRSIIDGECEMALAGGVSLLLNPALHISFSKAGMLSRDGKCKTFSNRADGYVRGEGVGMVVLKRLSAAERDGDQIYGVIRGSAENHGGRGHSLTAPNPQAQAEVIKEAYRRAGLSPASVSYIEAHGTGTELGDPVEINGLKSAFQSLYEERQEAAGTGYCGLGSVKTNIGHVELAAGIAGLIKVLLQMKHRTLVPSLHCDEVNPYIRLEGSPFYVVREKRPWSRLKDREGNEWPLRAGVSSFGFGGVNAHVLVEEYVDSRRDGTGQDPAMIVVSARDELRLKEQANRLLDAIVRRALNDHDLARLAYTLQVGREAMEHRLATTVRSMKELEAKLKAFVEGGSAGDALYVGRVQRNSDTLAAFRGDEELREAVDKWIQRGKWSRLLELWVKGLEVDWTQAYGADRPRRMSLPTYPFAKERYWVDTAAAGLLTATPAASATLHPMLHRNTSDLRQQRFSSTFTGDEFFLRDHRVRTGGRGEQRVLPAVAYLEMARAAVERALPDPPQSSILELCDTVWLKPLLISGQTEVTIELSDAEDGRVSYEISGVEAEGETIYCQGYAVFERHSEPSRLDPEELGAEMQEGRLEASDVYEILARIGFDYGPAHRGIAAIHLGKKQLFAELRLPALAGTSLHEYVLHPSVMDSAMQASIGLLLHPDHTPHGPILPFALQSVRIVSPCKEEMFAWVRYADGSEPGDRSVELDIDLCDREGNICIQMLGLASRVMEGHAGPVLPAATEASLVIERQEPAFDDDFYESVITGVANRAISVDEAVDLG